MKRLIVLAILFASIGGPAFAQAPTLKERWQARAEVRRESQRPSDTEAILENLGVRLHQAFQPCSAAKKIYPTTSPVAKRPGWSPIPLVTGLPGWRIRRNQQNGTPTFMTAPPAAGKVAAVHVEDPGVRALDFASGRATGGG